MNRWCYGTIAYGRDLLYWGTAYATVFESGYI